MMRNIASNTTATQLSVYDSEEVQPNAIDLKVAQIFDINNGVFSISEDEKVHRGSVERAPDQDGYWTLKEGTYEIIMEGEISIGPDEAGFVITRSTLNRNGVFLTSGLYDSGYRGVMAGTMHVGCGVCRVKKGTRVGQFLCFDAEAIGRYDGSYGAESAHDVRYAGEI